MPWACPPPEPPVHVPGAGCPAEDPTGAPMLQWAQQMAPSRAACAKVGTVCRNSYGKRLPLPSEPGSQVRSAAYASTVFNTLDDPAAPASTSVTAPMIESAYWMSTAGNVKIVAPSAGTMKSIVT